MVTVATRFLSSLEQAFQPLLQTPQIRPALQHLGAGQRVIFHSLYAIYYLPLKAVIVRVLHGAA
ncbi:type II toxin-antitoxin system RelE/ParE family toxin [Nitrosovibrio sp. Nv6]|uniref:type II toxin-antitoxin system RelE/ParE family toxin n=1 Tax=Nitrosovibrio sp. Nv6 TaxID=1855340 RepID=UPI003514791A